MNMISKWLSSSITASIIVSISGCAQSPTVEEFTALKQNQESMQKDLDEIKKQIAQRTPPKPKPFEPSPLSISGALTQGKADAPVTLVEFTDYQCPFCKRHATGTMPQILKSYVDTGKVRYVLRDFPLKQIHSNAFKLAQATLCAGDQGKGWEMHDHIFSAKKALDPNKLSKDAKAIGLDAKAFDACMKAEKYAGQVDASLEEGAKLGIRGTPGFFLGKTDVKDPGKIMATEKIVGAQPFAKFKEAIDKMLSEKK
ncbi:MAG: DsbA family protein [Gammaproteobacteria bacterium]